MVSQTQGRAGGDAEVPAVLDKCTPEEDAAFGELSAYCYKTKQRAHTNRGQTLMFRPKPMKKPRPSWVKQNERAAINRVVWGGVPKNT